MKKMWLFVTIFILVGMVVSSNSDTQFFPFKYEKFTLENGFTAYLIPVKGSGLVAYYSIVRTGSRDEWEPGKSGFAHFFEHMMFRGTKKYPGSVYDRMVTEMGADANAYTTDDYTCYHLVTPNTYLEKVMELESDRFQNLDYEEEAFKTEAGAVYGEYRKSRVNPYSVLWEELQNTAFDKHTYKHTTIGFERDIKNMPNLYEYSKSFFHRYYRPENVVLLIAGDFDPDNARQLIQKYYSGWKPGYVPPKITPEPEQRRERKKEVKYPGKTLPILMVAYKGVAFDPNNKTVAALDLLGDLAFGENSDIYKKLVLKEQKVQTIGAYFPYNRDPKLLHIYAIIKDEKDIPYVQEEIDKTVEKFKHELVEQKKLQDLKQRVRYSFLMNLETPDDIAGNLARFVALTGGIEGIEPLFANIQNVTAEEIQDVAQKYFQKTKRTVIILKGEK
ncbi:MAG: pitrilysin family protein [Calditrichia bacterium]